MKGIVEQFDAFLLEMDESELSTLTTSFNLESNHSYYHYTEYEDQKGQFYQVRYRSNINVIEVTTHNSYKTYSLEGTIKAKGNQLYMPQHFQRDFGLHLKTARKHLWAFAQLIVEKYTLQTFDSPISAEDE